MLTTLEVLALEIAGGCQEPAAPLLREEQSPLQPFCSLESSVCDLERVKYSWLG